MQIVNLRMCLVCEKREILHHAKIPAIRYILLHACMNECMCIATADLNWHNTMCACFLASTKYACAYTEFHLLPICDSQNLVAIFTRSCLSYRSYNITAGYLDLYTYKQHLTIITSPIKLGHQLVEQPGFERGKRVGGALCYPKIGGGSEHFHDL